jgi:hypothetical protein
MTCMDLRQGSEVLKADDQNRCREGVALVDHLDDPLTITVVLTIS